MKFSPNTIYHIYNQGNNRQPSEWVARSAPFARLAPSLPLYLNNTNTESIEMKFSPNTIYYIYNQGNNRQRIFFKDGMGLAAGLG
ncbi:MAG: hypothetical protein R3D58_14455 [Saprospiraceae bacterium]